MDPVKSKPPSELRQGLDAQQSPASPARRQPEATSDTLPAVLPPLIGALVGVVIIIAVAIVLGGPSGGLTALSAALLGQHSAWYLSRASAFVAYLLLWWSMVLGLSLTNRLARVWPGGPTTNDLHEHASLLGIVFALLHGLVLLGDSYIGYTLPQILIPFAGSYATLWVGLGQVGLYMMALVAFTFYVRQRIGARTWRSIHYLSFAVFALSLVHGLASGTDSGTLWAIWIYLSTGASVLALTIYRIWTRTRPAEPQPARLSTEG